MRDTLFLWLMAYGVHPDKANDILNSEEMVREIMYPDPLGLYQAIRRGVNGLWRESDFLEPSRKDEAKKELEGPLGQIKFMTMINSII